MIKIKKPLIFLKYLLIQKLRSLKCLRGRSLKIKSLFKRAAEVLDLACGVNIADHPNMWLLIPDNANIGDGLTNHQVIASRN